MGRFNIVPHHHPHTANFQDLLELFGIVGVQVTENKLAFHHWDGVHPLTVGAPF